jgi:hypothetical protein
VKKGPRNWFSGEVISQHEPPRSYMVKANNEVKLRRNLNHLKKSPAIVMDYGIRKLTVDGDVIKSLVPNDQTIDLNLSSHSDSTKA